ncbi:hypothetical protein CPB83DRAFT_862081 [Crepidotus variabilis]|uniref:Uncharacterized protein n=1 Tax=Crepidotus variabilis TaxID=179855 RepID=A0A9P6JK52_9AGAR|nr:hypothetical protein CPB83DRAFT_862081 [Crepidotus variabilis]
MPSTRYSSSPRKYPHSSDTELFETPPRKRFCPAEDEDDLSYSSASPQKKQRRQSPKKPFSSDLNLEQALRLSARSTVDHVTLLSLKDVPHDERSIRASIKSIIVSSKRSVMKHFTKAKHLPLETELYAKWLEGVEYVAVGLEKALGAKVPGTRRRVPGFGRSIYAITFYLVDEFIDEVSTHHDGWTSPDEPSYYPPTLSLVEEAKDDSTNGRSDIAVKGAEAILRRFDAIMAAAAKRYKVERGRNNPSLAERISAQEHALAKGCCLLCEQTGYGSDHHDIGDVLMKHTRDVLTQWKNEYDDCEDQLVDSN